MQEERDGGTPSKVNRDRPSARVLRAARDHLDWSQRQLAEKTGLDRNELYRYEAGMHAPSDTALLRLVDALGIPNATMAAVLEGDAAAADAYIKALATDALTEEPPESEESSPP